MLFQKLLKIVMSLPRLAFIIRTIDYYIQFAFVFVCGRYTLQ